MDASDVCMFVYNDVVHDARVLREATSLSQRGHRLTVVGLQTGGLPDREERDGVTILRATPSVARTLPNGSSPFLWNRGGLAQKARWLIGYGRTYGSWRREAVRLAIKTVNEPAIWHGHDLTGALAAADARSIRHGQLVYDSHELYLEAGTASRLPRMGRMILRAIERRAMRRADAVITVNDGVGTELSRMYGRTDVTIVMNCPPAGADPPAKQSSPLRREFALGDRPVILYHGHVTPTRMATSVEALRHLPDAVALVVVGQGADAPWLQELTTEPWLAGRLFTRRAVPVASLQAWISGADVGVMAIQPHHRNYVLSTPNKLFECINAGVPVVASSFPQMRAIVEAHGIGYTCDPLDPTSIAASVQQLLNEPTTAQADRRAWCRQVAIAEFSWERQEEVLIRLYRRLNSRLADGAHPRTGTNA